MSKNHRCFCYGLTFWIPPNGDSLSTANSIVDSIDASERVYHNLKVRQGPTIARLEHRVPTISLYVKMRDRTKYRVDISS